MAQRPLIGIITNLENDPNYLFPGYPRVTINEDYHRSLLAAGAVPLMSWRSGRVLLAGCLVLAAVLLLANVQGSGPGPLLRSVASTLLATVALEQDDLAAVRHHAITSLVAGQKLRNLATAAYALALWSGAEQRAGRSERGGRLFAVGSAALLQAWSVAQRCKSGRAHARASSGSGFRPNWRCGYRPGLRYLPFAGR